MSGSRSTFSSSGVTYTCFRDEQISQVLKDKFTRGAMTGRSVAIHSFSIHVRRGSSKLDELDAEPITFATSSSFTG